MNMSLSYKIETNQVMRFRMYESSGDLELFSLHRIRNKIKTLSIHPEVRRKLIEELIKENIRYRRNSGNNWMCITPQSLDNVVDNLRNYLQEKTNLGLVTLENTEVRKALEAVMARQADNQVGVIRSWFSDNYNNLLYDMQGTSKIPFPIVRKMREQLSQWAIQNTNPFSQPIDALIEETICSVGSNPWLYNSVEEMWEKLKGYH